MRDRILAVLCLCAVLLQHSPLRADETELPLAPDQETEHRYFAKQEALRKAKADAEMRDVATIELRKRILAKTRALQQVKGAVEARQILLVEAKERALAQMIFIAKIERQMKEAEERLVAAAHKSETANTLPTVASKEDALRRAKQTLENQPGRALFEIAALPNLAKGLPMTYQQDLLDERPMFIEPIQVTLRPTAGVLADQEAARRRVKLKIAEEARIKAEVQARLDAERGLAPKTAAKPVALKPKEDRLRDLVELYKKDKISPREYYAERAKIVAEP
ncbi:MAG: hypothetical protein EXS29_01940 [Pedosphaera sp.]|nr:hypothetical protein [Pedosphaera sp.]